MNIINEDAFQRNQSKSLSTRKEIDYFNTEDTSLKRFSKICEKNQTISDFDNNNNNLDKIKLTRSSLPMEIHIDNLSNYKNNNNIEDNFFDKRSSNNSKDFDTSSRDKLSNQNIGKNKIVFDSFQGGIRDIKVVWKNKPQDKEKEKEEEKDQLEKQYDNIEKFLNNFNEKCKINDNIEANYSSSTLGLTGSKKSMSKSDDKNIKINLKNIINYEKTNPKKNFSGVILSDIYNAEKAENKLDILINIMEEYKDIIMEKTFCKNFQDRLILNIFICLSQLSFKLYNCTENKTKFENIRKYISSFTDDIKYNLINNPNFTINLINQKLIDIINVDKKSSINNLTNFRLNDNNPINMIGSGNINSNSQSSKNEYNQSSYLKSDSISDSSKVNKENFINFFDEEIIYENFEEFKVDDGNDNDIYINPILYEIDTKNNNINNCEQNYDTNKKSSVENNFGSPQRPKKTKVRRNATNRMLLNKHHTKPPSSVNTIRYFNPNNYNFHIIDINGPNSNKDISSDSIDSDEDCIEVTESHKFEKQKLLFFDDYVKDKEKRRLTKMDSIEIKPDQRMLNQKMRLNELNEISYKNIIDIVNDDPSILPKHQLNLNPIDIANFIKEKEQKQIEEKDKEEKDEKEKEKEEDESKYIIYGVDSSSSDEEDEDSKEIKRFTFVDKNSEKIKEKNNEENLVKNKKMEISGFSEKSLSFQKEKYNFKESKKLLKLDFDYDDDD